MLHPYPFKGRVFRHFSGLLVMVLRHMRYARELDIKIAQTASDIEKLKKEIALLKGSKKEGTNSLRKINRKIRELKMNVASFCKSVNIELKDFKRTDIDDYTLLYKGSKYLRHLARFLISSKKMGNKHKETLRKGIEAEMKSIEGKAKSLELQVKQLERGVASTVVLSQISPWGNSWIERRIRVKAIEANALHKRLKTDKGEDLFRDFEKEISDIYEIGRNTNILMRRLKLTFNSIKSKLKDLGIPFSELEKTQHLFEKTFKRIGRIGRWLDNEIGDQSKGLEGELRVGVRRAKVESVREKKPKGQFNVKGKFRGAKSEKTIRR